MSPPDAKPPLSYDEALNGRLPETGELLDSIKGFIRRFVSLHGEAEADFLALYVAHTHAFDAAQATPYAAITSPERGCGKTLTAEIVELLAARAWKIDGVPTESVLFRCIERDKPTVIIDEADRLFRSGSERVEPLTAIVNGGNREGASVPRNVPKGSGGDFEVVDFSTFCPKVLVGIDHSRWPDTIRDRSVVVQLQRIGPGERVERFRRRKVVPEAEALCRDCDRWSSAYAAVLSDAEPEDMEELSPRAFDGWEPLLAIAELAGQDWSRRAREAARSLSGEVADEEASIGSALLTAIRGAMNGADWIGTPELLETINGDDSLPFGGWRQGKGLDGRTLASKLKPYGIRPKPVRRGEKGGLRGYYAEQFEEAWGRYVRGRPCAPDLSATPQQSLDRAESSATDPQQAENPQRGKRLEIADVAGVARVAPFPGEGVATPEQEAEWERLAAKHGIEL